MVVVDCGEDIGVSRLRAGEGTCGAGMGRIGGGDEMQFTNLRSDSLYASHSTAVKVW